MRCQHLDISNLRILSMFLYTFVKTQSAQMSGLPQMSTITERLKQMEREQEKLKKVRAVLKKSSSKEEKQ